MEAKDTVLSRKIYEQDQSYEDRVKQAEIFFKAGQATQKLTCSSCENAGHCVNSEGCFEVIEADYKLAKQEGRREVVEWVNENSCTFSLMEDRCFGADDWQAKLKEWGLA
jgi:hypothetical protein